MSLSSVQSNSPT